MVYTGHPSVGLWVYAGHLSVGAVGCMQGT